MKLVPKRRFDGFDENWGETELCEVADIYDGTHQTPKYKTKGVMFLSVENIETLRSVKYISKEAFERDFKVHPIKGDVLMTRIGDIGTANVVESDLPMAYYVSLALLKPKMLDPYFLKANIHSPSLQLEIYKRTLHIAFPKKINKNEIEKLLVKFPCIKEQQKIGSFFEMIDEKVTLEESKLNKLTSIKQAYLHEMFPAEGESVPKRRFEGFTGEWKEQKLGDIAEIVGGGTPSTSNPAYWNGNIDWYSPTEIGKQVFANGSIKTITQLGLEKSSANLLPANRTVLFTSRASIGDMAILRRPGTTNQGFQSLVLRDGIDTYFMYSMGYLLKAKALKNASGSTFLEISGNNLGKIKVLIPLKEEQQKIGSFFRKLDERIALQQAKVNKLKAMEQAYLHEMFV